MAHKGLAIAFRYLFYFTCAFFGEYAFASSSESDNFKVYLGAFFYGGGESSSSNIDVKPGVLGTTLNSESELNSASYIAVTSMLKLYGSSSALDEDTVIKEIKAKTSVSGQNIAEGTWQRDSGPYFYWMVKPEDAKLISGFSYSLDEAAEEQVKTSQYFYQSPDEFVPEGKHVFYVRPLIVKTWGKNAAFNIWVDVSVPVFGEVSPAPGAVVPGNEVEISCYADDLLSGIDPPATVLRVNAKEAAFEYDGPGKKIVALVSGLLQGENTVLIEAHDQAGNKSAKSWGFIIDASLPVGSIRINSGDSVAYSPYVILNLSASDTISGVKRVYLSNDGVFDSEFDKPYEYTPLIKDWLLAEPDKEGQKSVYAVFEDNAMNRSKPCFASITLKLPSAETRIVSGPKKVTQETAAKFIYESDKPGSSFSFKLDGSDWSEWSSLNTVSFSSLAFGNHYFAVKSAVDLNSNGKVESNEEDLSPAEWIWTVVKANGMIDKLKNILFWKQQ